METSIQDFKIEDVNGRKQYSVTNDVVGVTMKMLPVAGYEGKDLVFRKDQIEIKFVNHKNPNGEVKGEWFDWPYFITSSDLGEEMDLSNEDYIQEVFDKYKTKFMELKGMPPRDLDDLTRYKSFVGHIFQDIEEKRISRGGKD